MAKLLSKFWLRALLTLAVAAPAFLWVPAAVGEKPRTGPETEKRFPPLKVPPGFKATLFACDPLIEYPSVIARGPRPGTLFVAVDYLTGLGTEIVRRDEIRLIEDTDGDGYADKATVYAKGFNSIQGMLYHDGAVYVMHAPLLTVLRDRDGDGKADERRDLLSGLGLSPEENPVRLHCANGVVAGHDGWLYLALGDHGCDVRRPEGDRLVLKGGGILRCRPDGRDLHVFATGLRNIYDVALDDQLDVFVRDNENDGGDYKIRVCHSFFGADHGYPYHYYERPAEALPPLADLGLGSSAGGVCYLETRFPAEYRGNLFFCEWGRSVVRYRPKRYGSAFAPLKEIEFAAGADNDPYGFKPTDLVVDHDGSLIVADWADGQQPKRGRGRIYRISYVGKDVGGLRAKPVDERADIGHLIVQLNSESYSVRSQAQAAIERQRQEGLTALTEVLRQDRLGVRGRLHAVWIMARVGGEKSISGLLDLARTDPEPSVQAQAIRAIADLADPVLVRHRLDAGPGDAELAARLAEFARERDPRVLREVVVALGRLHWSGAPAWLRRVLTKPDPALAHAAMQTLRRSQNWPAVLKLLDEPDSVPVRPIASRALSERAVPEVVDGLIDRLRIEQDAGRRREYADALTRVHRKPGSQPYWGYRPAPRPPNTVVWDRTEAIEQALDRVLTDPDRDVRRDVLRHMQREKIPARLATLKRWLEPDQQPDRVAAILDSLKEQPAKEVRGLLASIVSDKKHSPVSRLAALETLAGGLDESSQPQLLELAAITEDGPVLARILRFLLKRPKLDAVPLLARKASSPDPEVRAAVIEVLAERHADEARGAAIKLLDDPDARVRQAAAVAAGKLAIRPAIESLLKLAGDADPPVRRASLEALRLLRERRALPLALAALSDHQTETAALACVAELGGPEQASAVTELAKRNPAAEILTKVVQVLDMWSCTQGLPAVRKKELERAVAEIQGVHGTLLRWYVVGPLQREHADQILDRYASPQRPPVEVESLPDGWGTVLAAGAEAPIELGKNRAPVKGAVWLGLTEFILPEQTEAQFLAAGSGESHFWLNGRFAHSRDRAVPFQPDSERFSATLRKGVNRLLVQVSSPKEAVLLQVRFRRKSSAAEQEQLTQASLTRAGNAELGRKLFFNAEKTQCIKCHRLGDLGERIGPELTGVGSRFSRIHIIESILQPSRTIAPSFETWSVVLKDGRTLAGVKIKETDKVLTLGDNQGQKHDLAKSAIEERHAQPVSTMPEGLEKRLTTQEFVDLISFLVSQKEPRSQ